MKLLYLSKILCIKMILCGTSFLLAGDIKSNLNSCMQFTKQNVSLIQAITIAVASINLASDLYDNYCWKYTRFQSALSKDNDYVVMKKMRYPNNGNDENEKSVKCNPWIESGREKHYNQRYAQSVSMACSAATLALCGYTIYQEKYLKKRLFSHLSQLYTMMTFGAVTLGSYLSKKRTRHPVIKKNKVYLDTVSSLASKSIMGYNEEFEEDNQEFEDNQNGAMDTKIIDQAKKESFLLSDLRLLSMQQLIEHVKFTTLKNLIAKNLQEKEPVSTELLSLYENQIEEAYQIFKPQLPGVGKKRVTFKNEFILYSEDDYNPYNNGCVLDDKKEKIILEDEVITIPESYCSNPENMKELAFLKDTFAIVDDKNCRINFEESYIACEIVKEYLGKQVPKPNELLINKKVPVYDIPYIIMSPRSFVRLHSDLYERLHCKTTRFYSVDTGLPIIGIRRSPSESI